MGKQKKIIRLIGMIILAIGLSWFVARGGRDSSALPVVSEVSQYVVGESVEAEVREKPLSPNLEKAAELEKNKVQVESETLESSGERAEVEADQDQGKSENESVGKPLQPAVVEEKQPPVQEEQAEKQNPSISAPESLEKDQEEEGVTAETVKAIEGSLSAADYARGLSLLAQLPIETVDRFVELRKEGFTKEEQLEIKEILLASFEGEDLDWILATYHKLKP